MGSSQLCKGFTRFSGREGGLARWRDVRRACCGARTCGHHGGRLRARCAGAACAAACGPLLQGQRMRRLHMQPVSCQAEDEGEASLEPLNGV